MPAKIIPRELSADQTTLRNRSRRIVAGLADLGITHAVGLPDNSTAIIFELLDSHPGIQLVPVCREGEAWAIAAGLWVGGKEPVVIIQNTGFLESGDALRGTAVEMTIPLLALMNYRGYHTRSKSDPDSVDSAASFFEPTLRAWKIPYHFLEENKETDVLQSARKEATNLRRPVALLMT